MFEQRARRPHNGRRGGKYPKSKGSTRHWRARRKATVPAVMLALASLSVGVGAIPASATPAPPARATATMATPDLVVSGVGEPDGYHLFVARSSTQWAWQPVTLLDPAGENDQTWVGNTCVTGDGSTAVAVIAPWSATNSPVGMARGAIAYGVNLATHQARVLAAGVSLAYFDPGCGAGSDVALTRYLGADEQSTELLRVDARSGSVQLDTTVDGELTSAVPVGNEIFAARGSSVLGVAAKRTSPIGVVPGEAYQLRPNAQGGVDLLSADSQTSGSAWSLTGGRVAKLGTGSLTDLALEPGAAGATHLFGVSTRVSAATAQLTVSSRSGAHLAAASLQGEVTLTDPPRSDVHAAAELPQILDASGKLLRAAAAPPNTAVPRVVDTTPTTTTRSARAAAGSAQTPTCAVPRVNPAIQVPQPSNGQVDWAIQNAVNNRLPSRPAGFDNLPGGAYSPESDFPQPSLTGGGTQVPAMVVAGVLAQESNFNQASWHAPSGTAGDPLTADYYGDAGSSSLINYAKADCGYGLGQITDIMRAGAYNATVQQRVAVDYAENVAAVVQHLGATWNQLAAYSPPLTVNNTSPQWLENWYTTLWAYNSGVQPTDSSYGLPSGCAQAGPPSCTDSAGNWGLGWSNNPVNPIYPPGRLVFLESSYADAAHPGQWPYQERVFGWMATPLLRYSPALNATVDAYGSTSNYLLQPPLSAFCSPAVNHCNPNDTNALYCGYQAAGPLQYHCWWHGNVTFAGGCATACTPDQAVSTTTAEPSAYNPDPPQCTLDTGQVPTSTSAGHTIVVTEESGTSNPNKTDLNVVGCPATPTNWTPAGAFTLSYAQDGQGDPLGQVDFHQLGGGFGGHTYFTHTAPAAGAATSSAIGTWTPGIATAGNYQIKVFIPDIAAVADPATYQITTANGSTLERTIDQSAHANTWVSLGDFALGANASVSLSNVTVNGDYATDIAYNAVAFIPRGGRLVQHTVDAFSNFGQNQSLSGSPGAWIEGDFASDSSLIQMANNLSSALLAYPACTGTNITANCVPAPVLTAMTNWQQAVASTNGHPVQWLSFSRPAPPNPLQPGYLDTGTNYKIRASVDVDFVVQANGQIDPASYTVTAVNDTGITEIPQFIRDMFSSIAAGYGIAQPDLTYAATNLEYFNGDSVSVNPLATGQAPGREYMPDLSVSLTNNNTCLQIQDLAGGSIGWKTLLTDDNVVNNVNRWHNFVDDGVQLGLAPQALSNLVDTITKDFFARPLHWNVVPWPGDGSIFYYAPPIWVESHFNDCVTGSADTITPAGNIDPVSNKAQLVDNSYMPDLYLAIDNTYRDKYGSPNSGAPVQSGDWPDFAASPVSLYPANTPWNACYIGPTTSFAGGGTLYFISRRDGNPWGLGMLSPNDLSSTVGFC